jgi:hypothetical protein
MPTMPPLLAEYAACPIWPSKAAMEASVTMAPRLPASSTGAVRPMAVAARRMQLKAPTRLTETTLAKASRS